MASIFKMCGKYLIKNKYSVICYGVLCLTSSMFSMISPYISGNFIDYLIVADNISKIYRYCFAFFGLFVFNQLIGYIVNRVYIKMQTQMGYDLNSDVIRHIQHLPVSFLKKQNMAYLNQRVNNDSNQVITFCINIVQGILINSLKLLLSIFVLVQFSCNITLLFIAIICAYALSYKILKKILFKAQFILTEAQANYFSKLFEQFDNILFVKMQAIYEAFLSRLKKEFQNILKVSLQYQKISYLFSSLDSLIMSLAQIGIFIMGGALVIRGKLSVGQLTIMLSYFGIMMEASRYFFSLTKTISDILVYISVLPIIIVCAFAEGKSLLGVAVAFIYGYFATMEGSMLNWFPIKAAMILVDPKCGSEYGITYKIPPAAMSIIGVLVVSILLFQMLNRTKKNVYMKSKRKVKVKQTRRKGW